MPAILDFIFPKRCVSCGKIGKYFCKNCTQKIQRVANQVCPICTRASIDGVTHPRCYKPLGLDGLTSVFYFSSPIREAIHKLKYRLVSDLAQELVDLSLSSKDLTSIIRSILNKEYILVPVPLHKNRQKFRGFNQAEILANLIGERWKIKVENGLLERKKNTKSQVDLKGRERKENVRAAFSCINRNSVRSRNFLVVDDMVTTGATLHNCARALKLSGASQVFALTIARTLPSKN